MEKTYRSISQTKIWVDEGNREFLQAYLTQSQTEKDSRHETGDDW
jgi:hypothetical protein